VGAIGMILGVQNRHQSRMPVLTGPLATLRPRAVFCFFDAPMTILLGSVCRMLSNLPGHAEDGRTMVDRRIRYPEMGTGSPATTLNVPLMWIPFPISAE
jgi:hypothetical protein